MPETKEVGLIGGVFVLVALGVGALIGGSPEANPPSIGFYLVWGITMRLLDLAYRVVKKCGIFSAFVPTSGLRLPPVWMFGCIAIVVGFLVQSR